MKKVGYVLMVLSLAGCAVEYTRPGTSAQQANMDIKRCKFEAQQGDGVAWPDLVNLCLEAKGYTGRRM